MRERSRLVAFRRGLYGCFTRWGDALFELVRRRAVRHRAGRLGARAQPRAGVPPQPRQPLQGARQRVGSTRSALRRLLVEHRPADWPLVFAVDASTWDRCDAECSPERGFYYSASKHSAGQPIVAGWNYQWICQLDWAPDSWTAPLDVRRIPPAEDATTATVDQIRRLVGLLPGDGEVPLFVFDAGYDPIAIGHDLADVPWRGALSHPRRPRLLRRSAPSPQPTARDRRTPAAPRQAVQVLRSDRPGRSRRAASSPPIPATGRSRSPPGTGCTPGSSAAGAGRTTTRAADRARQRDPRRRRAPARSRPPARRRRSGCGGPGDGEPDLERCWRAYLRRFDIEHTFRFVKNTLGWTTPSLCTPEQADRWTWLVVAAYTQLRLARGLVDDLRLPWERPRDPAQLTPAGCDGGFVDFVQRSARRPVHRNPRRPVRDARKGPENRREPAIRRSKRPPDKGVKV